MTQQQPTVGRIVHFYNEQDVELAAIVTNINENGTLDLHVFLTDGSFSAHNVEHTTAGDMGHWDWPDRKDQS